MAFHFGNNFKLKRSLAGGFPPSQKSFAKFLDGPPTTAEETLNKAEIVAVKKKKTRSLLDIGLKGPPTQRDSPAAAAADSGEGTGISRREKVLEGDRERRRRRWEALLDAAAIATIREYEGNLGREDVEFRAENRIRNPRKSGGGGGGKFVNRLSGGDLRRYTGGACGLDAEIAVSPSPTLPPLRSKRGRTLAAPNKYRDSVLASAAAAEEDDEFQRRRNRRRPMLPAIGSDGVLYSGEG